MTLPRAAMPRSGEAARIFVCAKCDLRGYDVVFFGRSENRISAFCFPCADRYGPWMLRRRELGDMRPDESLIVEFIG